METIRVGRAKSGTVRLWTIQRWDVWERLQRHRVLLVDRNHPNFSSEFIEAYDWIRTQMSRRIASYQGRYPWWAYDYKLDLRRWRYQSYPPHELQVRLELAVPDHEVLLSSYHEWNQILNRGYVPSALEDGAAIREIDEFDAELTANALNCWRDWPLPEPWYSRLVASWDRIFDVETKRGRAVIQATFEQLRLEDVVAVTPFVSAPSRWSKRAKPNGASSATWSSTDSEQIVAQSSYIKSRNLEETGGQNDASPILDRQGRD